jgi:outer membrane protein TolC
LSQKNSTLTNINIIENVTKAFYLVLVNKSRGQLLDVNIGRLDTLFRQTQAMYKNGFVEKIDVDRIEVTFQNLKVEKLKFDNLNNLGYALLKYQMGMPVEYKLEVQGSIEELESEIKTIAYEEKPDAQQRIEYSLLETQRRLNVLDIKRINSGMLPSLVAFGTVGVFRSANNFATLFDGKYYDYNRWGISLNQPIFGGFAKSYQKQQAKLAVKKSDNSLLQLKNSLNLQVQQSSINLKNNIQTLDNLKRNMDLSSNVARVTKIKYQQGVGSNIELIDAEASYREATTNFYNALYDALVSKIDYQKSLGKISNQ